MIIQYRGNHLPIFNEFQITGVYRSWSNGQTADITDENRLTKLMGTGTFYSVIEPTTELIDIYPDGYAIPSAETAGTSVFVQAGTMYISDGSTISPVGSGGSSAVSSAGFGYESLTPNLFLNPAATGTGSGLTAGNAFTTFAQLQAHADSLAGNMSGKILGISRDATIYAPDGININNVYGIEGNPFIIMPYGDVDKRPTIIGSTPTTTFVPYVPDPRIWTIASAQNQDIIDTRGETDWLLWHRYPKVASIAALQTSGAGFATYVSGALYFIPISADNPNFGSVHVTNKNGASPIDLFTISFRDIAASGNISVYGLRVLCASNCAIRFNPVNVSQMTSTKNISVVDCEVGFTGIDEASPGAADGVLIGGWDATRRIENASIIGCRSHNIINNAYEMNNISRGEIAYCYATFTNGNVVELFNSCSNVKTHHVVGVGVLQETFVPKTAAFGNNFYWQPGYSNGTTVDATGLLNVNNSCEFCVGTKLEASGVLMGTGSVIVKNCVLVGGGGIAGSGASTLRMTGGGAASLEVTNTVITAAGALGYDMIRSTGATDVISGNSNVIARPLSVAIGNCTFRNTSAAFATFVTNVQAVTAGALTVTSNADPMLGSDFVPRYGSFCIGRGSAQSEHGADVNGNIINGNHIGAATPAAQKLR